MLCDGAIEEPDSSPWTKKALFVLCFCIITTQYFFFTMPLAYLVNELIDGRDHSKVTTGSLVGTFSFSLAAAALLSNKFTVWSKPRQTLLMTVTVLTCSTPLLFWDFSKNVFLVVLFVTRVAQGFAIGLCEPQLMSVMTSLYPERLGFVTGSFELAASISSTVGPLIGGFLYESYGFAVTYTVPSVINLIVSIGGLTMLGHHTMIEDEVSSDETPPPQHDQKRSTFCSLFILPVVLLGMVTETNISMIVNTIESFYPDFYRVRFDRHEGYVGTVLAISGFLYCVATIVAGYLSDRNVKRKYVMLTGITMIIGGCLVIVPPFIFKTSDIWAALMLCMINFGSGITQISILPCLIIHYQYKTRVSRETSSCQMSGLYRAAYFTGAFFGPVVGGTILEMVSYQTAYTVLALVLLANLLLLLTVEFVIPNTIEQPIETHGSYENLESINSE